MSVIPHGLACLGALRRTAWVMVLAGAWLCAAGLGSAQAPSTQESLTRQVAGLGVSPKQVVVEAGVVSVLYRNTTSETDVVVFGAVLEWLSHAAASAPVLKVTAELSLDADAALHRQPRLSQEFLGCWFSVREGTPRIGVEIKPGEVGKFVSRLLTERQQGRADVLLAGHVSAAERPGAGTGAPPAVTPEHAPGPPAEVPREPDRKPARPLLGATFHGPTGLIRTPNADTLPAGTIRLSVTWPPDVPRPAHPRIPLVPDFQHREVLGIGLLPGVEGGVALNRNPQNDLDVTVHGKLRVVKEGRDQPAIAIGASNLRPSVGKQNLYVVASKTLFDDRLRASVGWSRGGLAGPFGGMEVRLSPWATGIAEYDGTRFNTGLRLTPTPRLQVELAEMKGGLGGQAAYSFEMGSDVRGKPGVDLQRAAAGGTPDLLAGRLADAVVALGMENVRVVMGKTPEGLVAGITYENRRYYRNQLEALGMVLAVAAQTMPESVVAVSVVVLNHEVPVLRLGTDLNEYLGYVRGDLSAARYAAAIEVDHGTRPSVSPASIVATTRRRARTALSADLSLTPLVRAIVGSENRDLSVRTAALPALDADLGSGCSLQAAKEVRLSGSFGMFDGYLSEDQLNANYVSRLGPDLIAHVGGGQFTDRQVGGAVEAFWLPGRSPLLVRGFAARLQDRRFGVAGDWGWMYLGDVRYWLGGESAEVGVSCGKYLDGDTGFAVSAGRFFGDDELRLEFRDTDVGRLLLAQFILPLGPDRFPRPHGVRARWGDHTQIGWKALAGSGAGPIPVTAVTGNQLRSFDLSGAFLDRDRFNPSAVRHGLDILRSTAAIGVRTSTP
jgi:hypothetical protein